MLFNYVFANNTILLFPFFFFLITELYILISAVIAQIFSPTAELVIRKGIPTKDAKAEIGTNPVTTEAKISKSPI